MNRRRPLYDVLFVYAIVAMSSSLIAVAGEALSSSSPRHGQSGRCVVVAATPDTAAQDACVTQTPTGPLADDAVPYTPDATDLAQGRGKKKKKKNTAMNMIIGGGIMTAYVIIIIFLKMITVTLGKAFLFTFITKFLVSMNWKSSSSKKKTSGQDLMIVMTR